METEQELVYWVDFGPDFHWIALVSNISVRFNIKMYSLWSIPYIKFILYEIIYLWIFLSVIPPLHILEVKECDPVKNVTDTNLEVIKGSFIPTVKYRVNIYKLI